MLDGKSLYDAMVQENVNKTAGVPTIYGLLLQHISSTKSPAPPSLKTVLIGGSACPPSMIQAFDNLGVNAQHAVSQSQRLIEGLGFRAASGIAI
jgi:acyl-CoA synthetase (AMP-forming)/AMP-acid ligase II